MGLRLRFHSLRAHEGPVGAREFARGRQGARGQEQSEQRMLKGTISNLTRVICSPVFVHAVRRRRTPGSSEVSPSPEASSMPVIGPWSVRVTIAVIRSLAGKTARDSVSAMETQGGCDANRSIDQKQHSTFCSNHNRE